MIAQGVYEVGEIVGHLQLVSALCEAIKTCQKIVRACAGIGLQLDFDELQLTVQPGDAAANAPVVHLRRETDQGIRNRSHRNQDQQ